MVNYGKWRGKPLRQIDSGYFKWVLSKDFPPDFTKICRDALEGKFPSRA